MKRIHKSLVVILFLDMVASYASTEKYTGPDQQFSHSLNSVPKNAINNVLTPEGIREPLPNLGNLPSFFTANGPITKSIPNAQMPNITPQQRQRYYNNLQINQAGAISPMSVQQQIQQKPADYDPRLASQFKIQNQITSQNDPRLATLDQANIAAVPLQNYQLNNFQNMRQNIPMRGQYPMEQGLPRPVNPTFQGPRTGHNLQHILATNPTVKHVLSTTKQQKRYMVIHPDGRVEHVDEIETIAKKHPYHILVNAGPVIPLNNIAMSKPIAIPQKAYNIDSTLIEHTKRISETPNQQPLATSSVTLKPQENAERHESSVTSKTVVQPDIMSHIIVAPQKLVVSSEAATSLESATSPKSVYMPETLAQQEKVTHKIEIPHIIEVPSFEAVTIPETHSPAEILSELLENIVSLEEYINAPTTSELSATVIQTSPVSTTSSSESAIFSTTSSEPKEPLKEIDAGAEPKTDAASSEAVIVPEMHSPVQVLSALLENINSLEEYKNAPTASESSETVIHTSPVSKPSSSESATTSTTLSDTKEPLEQTTAEAEPKTVAVASNQVVTIPETNSPVEIPSALLENIVSFEETPGKASNVENNALQFQDLTFLEPVKVPEIIDPSEKLMVHEYFGSPETVILSSSPTESEISATTYSEHETTSSETVTSSSAPTESDNSATTYSECETTTNINVPTAREFSAPVIQKSPVSTTFSSESATSSTTSSDTKEPLDQIAAEAEPKIVTSDSSVSSSLSTSDASSASWFKTSEAMFWDNLLAKDPINLIYFYHVPSQTAGNDEYHENQEQFNSNESSEENIDEQVSLSKTSESEFWEELFKEKPVDFIYFLHVPSKTDKNDEVCEENSSMSSATVEEPTNWDNENEEKTKVPNPVRIIEPDGQSDGKTIRYVF